MHFYGLIYAKLARGDEKRVAAYKERAALFAKDIRHWFDEDGGTLAFGRSLTYRFACGGFWGALAFADVEALPWGEIKGQFMRHLRWWADKPIANRDGILSIGYGYPNLFMSESYNSAGSPYWALKAFLPLALPDDHPFWTAEETPAVTSKKPIPLKHPGMVMHAYAGQCGGAVERPAELADAPWHREIRQVRLFQPLWLFGRSGRAQLHMAARSTGRWPFPMTGGTTGCARPTRWRRSRRTRCSPAGSRGAMSTVETWLIPANLWHIRVHRITTPRALHATEGGFAIGRADLNADTYIDEPGRGVAKSQTDVSAIVDLVGTARRAGVPGLSQFQPDRRPRPSCRNCAARFPSGRRVLVTAAMALPAGAEAEAALAQSAACARYRGARGPVCPRGCRCQRHSGAGAVLMRPKLAFAMAADKTKYVFDDRGAGAAGARVAISCSAAPLEEFGSAEARAVLGQIDILVTGWGCPHGDGRGGQRGAEPEADRACGRDGEVHARSGGLCGGHRA